MEEPKKESMLDVIEKFPDQIAEAYGLPKGMALSGSFSSIVVCGMGGSGIPGDLLRDYLRNAAVYVNKSYDLPDFINPKTLVFIISYSGNTEETINCFKLALKKGAQIIGITSGGTLRQLCDKNSKQCVVVPSGMQPRAALAYLFFPILRILGNSGILPEAEEDVKRTIKALSVPWFKERAEVLAGKIHGSVPIVYGTDRFGAVAYRWKTQFNENAKIHAFSHAFPELDHNELVGYTRINANYYVIIIRDEADMKKMKDRISITKDIIADSGVKTTELLIKGSCYLAKAFSAIHLGDLTSYYLALKNKVDPTPVKVVEELKKRLA